MGMDDVNTISPEEKQLIVKLRERVKDDLPESFSTKSEEDQDFYLVRWLRARDMNLDNATKMLHNSLKWREENDMDRALERIKVSQFYRENFPYTYVGQNKLGHPVYLLPLAFWDFRKIGIEEADLAEFTDFLSHFFESVVQSIANAHKKSRSDGGPPITQFMFIIDVKSYPYGQLMSLKAIKRLLQCGSTYEAHYPEVLFKAFFVNCPSYFNLFINILKPVLAPRTLGKLICYSQMAQWEKDMIEYVDPSTIPKQYGGLIEES